MTNTEILNKAKFIQHAREAANKGRFDISERVALIEAAGNAEILLRYTADALIDERESAEKAAEKDQ